MCTVVQATRQNKNKEGYGKNTHQKKENKRLKLSHTKK